MLLPLTPWAMTDAVSQLLLLARVHRCKLRKLAPATDPFGVVTIIRDIGR